MKIGVRRVILLLMLGLTGVTWGQATASNLPDAPSQTTQKPPRGKKKLLLLLGVSLFEQAANVYDTRETEIGLKRGVAVEANTFWVGRYPTARGLYTRDVFQLGICITSSLVAWAFRSKPFYYAGLTLPVVLGAKHIQAGNQWDRLVDGEKPTGSELGPDGRGKR